MIMKIEKKDFKSLEEVNEWEHKYYKNHDWDNQHDFEKFCFDIAASAAINQIDTYAKSLLDVSNKIQNELIKAEEEAKSAIAKEVVKEKTDANVSKLQFFKKIGNKICQFGRKVTSHLPYVGYKTLYAFTALVAADNSVSAIKKISKGKYIEGIVDAGLAGMNNKVAVELNKAANESKIKAKEKN